MDRAVRPVPQHPVRQWHPQRLPRHRPAGGFSGQNVRLVQFWLKIARTVYSNLNNVTVDGNFGSATTAAVKRFQTYWPDQRRCGGPTTWNKLYEVYNDIANNCCRPACAPGEYPGVLRKGSSGTAVRELQFYLYLMSATRAASRPLASWTFRCFHRGCRAGLPALLRG